MPEDRIVIATLQRMYGTSTFRLTSIGTSLACLRRAGITSINCSPLPKLERSGQASPTLLVIVRQQRSQLWRRAEELPQVVQDTAQFGARQTYLGRKFVEYHPARSGQAISSAYAGNVRSMTLKR
jgi:hypothetical protein